MRLYRVCAGLKETQDGGLKLPGVSPFGYGRAAVRIVDSVLSRLGI